jgi:hypothetical protein
VDGKESKKNNIFDLTSHARNLKKIETAKKARRDDLGREYRNFPEKTREKIIAHHIKVEFENPYSEVEGVDMGDVDLSKNYKKWLSGDSRS